MKIRNKFLHACIIFTIITITSSLLKIDGNYVDTTNLVYRFIVSVIAVYTFYIFEWLESWPLRLVEVIHYLVSLVLILTFAYFTDLFIEPVSKGGYLDLSISYTLVYIIASIVYEVKIRFEIRNQNQYLKEIKTK